MATDTITVRYTSNQDNRKSTKAIWLDGRPDIVMGDIGEVTEPEYQRLVGLGHVLEVVDVDNMKQEELQEIADQRGLVVEGSGKGGNVTKKDLVNAISQSVDTAEPTPAPTRSVSPAETPKS